MNRTRRILHPTDFSPASRRALDKAIELAKQNKAELLLVHVNSVVAYVTGEDYTSQALYEKLESTAKREAESGMSALIKKAQKAKIKVKSLLLKGTPYNQIARVAKSRRADLIIMGTHGRTGFSKFFLGSVAERVIATAHCPVLAVRGR